jgi:hypothetical protein
VLQVSETMQLIRMVEYDKKRVDAEDAAGACGRLYGGSGHVSAPVVRRTAEDVARSVHDQEMKRFEWFARIYPPLEFAEVCLPLSCFGDDCQRVALCPS